MKPVAEFYEATMMQKECDKHGKYQSKHVFGKVWSGCPSCLSESYAAEKIEREERDRVERKQSWERRIGQAGIPDRFHDRSLKSFRADTPAQQQALATCAKYANEFNQIMRRGSCIIMCGKPGTGKTHLAVGIGLHVMDAFGTIVLFTTVMRAIRSVKETYSRDSQQSESQAIAELVFPDLLILDEVGVQFGSDAEKLILFDILNDRYEKRKPTIFLTNKTIEDFKSYVGERIYDRLREDGCEYIPFTWDSHRGKA